MNFLTLLALSIAPGIAIGIYVYLKDKHEREPIGLLLLSFFYGGLSALLTLLISWPLTAHVKMVESSISDQFIKAFFIVALVEETSKFLFVRFVLYYNKNFNEPFDGIVYALLVSMGFATLENILYTFQYGIGTGILRMFTAVPAHATFGILMGYFLGKAKFSHHRMKSLYYAALALAVATLFHGAYDYFWFINFVPGVWMGAILSLIIGIWLSGTAIKLHQHNSPFREKKASTTEPTNEEKE